MEMNVAVGQKVELNDGRLARVRFVGTTSFQTGEWVGVELEDVTGKNDGSVKGERYFTCAPNHGMFLRVTGISRIVEDARPKPKPLSNGMANKVRPSSMHAAPILTKRSSVVLDPRRTSTIAPSPTPRARAGTGIQSPTKQLGTNGAATAAGRTTTPLSNRRVPQPPAATKTRQSIAPLQSVSHARRPSTLPSTTSARSTRPGLSRPSAEAQPSSVRTSGTSATSQRHPLVNGRAKTSAGQGERVRSSLNSNNDSVASSAESQSESQDDDDTFDNDDTIRANFAPRMPPTPAEVPDVQTRSRRPSSPTAASIHSQRTIRSTAASNRQIEELEAKVRLLERKRIEDRDVKKNLEQTQQERDQYKTIIEKLQAKYRPQQQEIIELKKSLEVAEQKAESIMALQADHDTVMELATIDREMAEEKAQGLEEQLDALRARSEELELELEILREENEELGKEMSPEERNSAGWLQMEKSNERLREALLRLRDITQDKEQELRDNIVELETNLRDFETLKTVHDDTQEKLSRTETNVHDLRQQLEAAQESEEIIEQLTEQKAGFEERIHQLRNTIEELEELRELNDELVINHQEEEKQMQEEIDFRDSLILDRERTGRQQQEALDQADYTIMRYRTLVSELQASLKDLEASKQISETEATQLSSKSRAMFELNTRLQSSVAKTQVKAIDLELQRLDAQEASEHLSIVQLFLPESFERERDSILALLRLKRITFKSRLMQSLVRERIASFGTRGDDEDVFSAGQIADNLDWMASMSDCFVNAVSRSDPDDFVKCRDVLFELEPVERALNGYIENLRQEEFDEANCSEELNRSAAVMTHLASIHISDDLANHSDDLIMRSQCMQTRLDTAAACMGHMRTLIESRVRLPVKQNKSSEESETEVDTDDDSDGTLSDLQIVLNRLEALNNQLRSVKVTAGKFHRSLNELEERSLTLDASWTEPIEKVQNTVGKIATYSRRVGSALQQLLTDDGRVEPFTPSEIARTIAPVATSSFDLSSGESGPFNAVASQIRDLGERLSEVVNFATDLDNAVEFDRTDPPWLACAEQLRQSKASSIDTETQLVRALSSVTDRDVLLKEKETELEEQSVRIEMLEARMRDAGKRSAKIAELEQHLQDMRDGEKRARSELARARQDAAREMEKVRGELSRLSKEQLVGNTSGAQVHADAMGASTRANIKRQELKITALEGAVRYFKDENRRLQLPSTPTSLRESALTSWLHEPLVASKSEHQKRRDIARRQTRDVLDQLLHLTTSDIGPAPNLTTLPTNKLAWRSAQETARWNVEHRKEQWEAWRTRRRMVVSQASGMRSSTVRPLVRKIQQQYAIPSKEDASQALSKVEIVDTTG